MTYYQYLLLKQQTGDLQILKEMGLFPTHYTLWMEIFAYHLMHPQCSQWIVAMHFNTHKRTVYNAYHFMMQTITNDAIFRREN